MARSVGRSTFIVGERSLAPLNRVKSLRPRRGFAAILCAALVGLLVGACASPAQGAARPSPEAHAGLNPTEFVQTLVAQAAHGTAAVQSLTRTPPSDSPGAIADDSNRPTRVPTTTPILTPTATVLPTETPCLDCPPPAHLWLARPVGAGAVNYPDPTYRYGDTQHGAREPHHGIEFQNPTGTPVLAVADSTVIVAGNDWSEPYGPELAFYGTLVVLELDRRYRDQPVYALYGHLSEISVRPGQKVKAGDALGQVGSSGVALGPHLHFEVRVETNNYASTRNPELWFLPLSQDGRQWGALAGLVADPAGRPLPGITVVIRSLDIEFDQPVARYPVTYADDDLNGDNELHENFGLGDLPPGTYEVSVNTTKLHRQVVAVEPGKVSFVAFQVNPPPPSATPSPSPTP